MLLIYECFVGNEMNQPQMLINEMFSIYTIFEQYSSKKYFVIRLFMSLDISITKYYITDINNSYKQT